MVAAEKQSELLKEYPRDNLCRILSLDGGGAKGFYTLGVLKEIEAMLDCPLYKRFDLIFGTSTGAIIAALLALGNKIDDIHDLYKKHVPTVMSKKKPAQKTKALAELASEVFGTSAFTQVKTQVGIVATKWVTERPMIFKGSVHQAHGRTGTSRPVSASQSQKPFKRRVRPIRSLSGKQSQLRLVMMLNLWTAVIAQTTRPCTPLLMP